MTDDPRWGPKGPVRGSSARYRLHSIFIFLFLLFLLLILIVLAGGFPLQSFLSRLLFLYAPLMSRFSLPLPPLLPVFESLIPLSFFSPALFLILLIFFILLIPLLLTHNAACTPVKVFPHISYEPLVLLRVVGLLSFPTRGLEVSTPFACYGGFFHFDALLAYRDDLIYLHFVRQLRRGPLRHFLRALNVHFHVPHLPHRLPREYVTVSNKRDIFFCKDKANCLLLLGDLPR